MDALLTLLVPSVAGFAGALVYSILPFRTPRVTPPWKPNPQAHEHRWDTMRADNKGWRCGICDEPRGK
jgi:hypothetical protein